MKDLMRGLIGMRVALASIVVGALVMGGGAVATSSAPSAVRLLRIPNHGIQPMAEVDRVGTVHLIYFSGQAMAGDVFYVTQSARSSAFSQPVRVNSQPGSVIASGTIRGAHMALGKNGRVHVAWMGSGQAEPRGPEGASPMLYARSAQPGKGFEAQRNLIHQAFGLDGGGTVAADAQGAVYVVWHAGPARLGEEQRRVLIAKSTDDGATFAREVAVSEAGVCNCCGMKAILDPRGTLRILYRAFRPSNHRDMYLLTQRGSGWEFDRRLLEAWSIGVCPLSTTSAIGSKDDSVLAWETDGQVSWARINNATSALSSPVSPPGSHTSRKHPAVAMRDGEVLLAWTEGMAWARGGTLHWQGFDRQGKPTDVRGSAPDVPVWSRPAVVAHPQGGFAIIY